MGSNGRFVDSYLPYLLMQAAFRMSARFHDVLKQAKVRESEWRVLATLSGHEGMRMGELERHVLLVQSTLSRTIGRMETKGLVLSHPDPEDGRAQLLVLSASGQKLAHALIDAARAHEDADLAHLALDQRSALVDNLSSLFPALGFAESSLEDEDTPFRMKVRVK
jgi:DNA-binding MarR family transcriptional regulator